MPMPPRLAFSHLRVDVGGVPAVDGLTLTSTGDHVLVLGAARSLFEAAAGLRGISRGEVRIGGLPAAEAIRARVAACAPLDPPLPSMWTILQYTVWGARLSGHERGTALALATEALARLQIESLAKVKLAAAPMAARRAAVLAGALATGAPTVLLEDPTVGLPDEAAHDLARTTARAYEDRYTAFFAGRISLQSPLALAADEAIIIEGSEVAAQGAPGEVAAATSSYVLRAQGNIEAFQRAIEVRGGRAASLGTPLPTQMRVELGPLRARDLLCIAAECDTTVVELRPLSRSFA